MTLVSQRQRAFTLIEVLVAIAILAVVALLAYRATAAMTDGEARLTQESDRWRSLDKMFAKLESDMRQAIPRSARIGTSVEPPWLARVTDSGGNSTLTFTRSGPEFSVEPGIAGQRIGYRLRDGAIEALYWPQLDNVPGAVPEAYVLSRNIDRFRVEQLTSKNVWSLQWPLLGEANIPRAVRIEIEFADGTTIERLIALR
ncbi:MAG TPA: type II secretion system minor pseudopilin GspJ [Casimicrobiaceae bacterium]|jgi:general secretion pathway protein J